MEKLARESSRTPQAIAFRLKLGYNQHDIRHHKNNQCEEKLDKESLQSKPMKVFSNEKIKHTYLFQTIVKLIYIF